LRTDGQTDRSMNMKKATGVFPPEYANEPKNLASYVYPEFGDN